MYHTSSLDDRFKREASFELTLPPDDFRERRYIFLETNRMPKEIREKLTKDQLDKLPYRDTSASRVHGSNDNFPMTDCQTFKTAHLRQIYQRKSKLWSGSIARRHARKEVGRRATTFDISRSLGIPSNRTSDDYYSVSQTVNLIRSPLKQTCPKCEATKRDADFIITNSEPLTTMMSTTTAVSRNSKWLPASSSATQPSLPVETEDYNMSSLEFDEEIKGGSCILVRDQRQKIRAVQTVPVTKQRPIVRRMRSSPAVTNDKTALATSQEYRQSNQLEIVRLPEVARKKSKSRSERPSTSFSVTTNLSTSTAGDLEIMGTDPRVRKPVIPSLTQLADVMNNCKALRSPTSMDERKQKHLTQAINKYHGNQIVVDSTEYDNFARKQSKKN